MRSNPRDVSSTSPRRCSAVIKVQFLGDPGDGQVLNDDSFQRPLQLAAGQLGARLGSLRGVLAPHPIARRARVSADAHEQRGRMPAHRQVHHLARDRAPQVALRSTSAAALLTLGVLHATLQDGPVAVRALPRHEEAWLGQTTTHSQVRWTEGGVTNVWILRMVVGGALTIGGPRTLPAHQR